MSTNDTTQLPANLAELLDKAIDPTPEAIARAVFAAGYLEKVWAKLDLADKECSCANDLSVAVFDVCEAVEELVALIQRAQP